MLQIKDVMTPQAEVISPDATTEDAASVMKTLDIGVLPVCDDEGLVAIGGDLSIERLRAAYAAGIFPWYNDGFPVLWWSPNPRAILTAEELHVSRSLARRLKRKDYLPAFMAARSDVMEAMAAGFALKIIWEHMHEIGRIPFRYETFLKYVHRHITNAPAGSENPITQPQQAAE